MMDIKERMDVFKEALGSQREGMPEERERAVQQHLSSLSEDEFSRLCTSLRVAEVSDEMSGYLRRGIVNLLAGALLLWSTTRVSAHWLLVLMLACAVLILVSLYLDVLSYLRLDRRVREGLGRSVGDVLLSPGDSRDVVREFYRNLGPDGPAA